MDFGKRITTESFFNGRIRSVKMTYSVPSVVTNKNQVLNELMKCLDVIAQKKPENMTIRISLDKRTHEYRMITHEYEIDT